MSDDGKLIDPDKVVELGLLKRWEETDPENPDEPASYWASVKIDPGEMLDIILKTESGIVLMEVGESRKQALAELQGALDMYWTYLLDLSSAIKTLADNLPEE